MNINFIEPQNPILKKILRGYYIAEYEQPTSYLIYPTNNVAVSTTFNVQISYIGNTVKVKPTHKSTITSDFICSYDKPLKFISEGKYKEITFLFKPLGLNSLLKKPLSLQNIKNNEFSVFDIFDDYDEMICKSMNCNDIRDSLEVIENYWLSKYKCFENDILKNIVIDIQQNPNISINSLSKKYNTSRQYINKMFHLHLCKSPSVFKKTQRFRNTLENYAKSQTQSKPLTELTYESFFYDQSHLIKDFHSFSKMPPSVFFKKNICYEKGQINWGQV